jgi:HEAT repeat protein
VRSVNSEPDFVSSAVGGDDDTTITGCAIFALGALLSSDPDPFVRAEIAFDLAFGNPSTAVPILLAALDDPSPEVVAAAADSLGFLDDASATDDLRTLLEDESQSVREAARDALEMLEAAE